MKSDSISSQATAIPFAGQVMPVGTAFMSMTYGKMLSYNFYDAM